MTVCFKLVSYISDSLFMYPALHKKVIDEHLLIVPRGTLATD